MIDAGMSECPICKREWLVTPFDDCFVPICGCYGEDTSSNNKNRPCEKCGLKHTLSCKVSSNEVEDNDILRK